MINLNENSKVLIINTAFLGDIILTSFLTQKLKNTFNCNISVLTTQIGAEALSVITSIDELFILDKRGSHKSLKETKEFAKKLSTYGFDTIISLHKSYRTAIIVKNIKSKLKIGFNTATKSGVYNIKAKYKYHLHEAERYISTCFDDLSLEKVGFDIPIDDKLYVENIANIQSSKKTVLLAPGSVWETKKWGNERYYKLAEKLSKTYNIVIVGSQSDSFESPTGITNICGKTKLPQLFHLFNIADAVVTNDSAPTHFASVTNTPTITIFGPTHPMFGFAPLSVKNKIIQNENLKCRPCRAHGSVTCPIGTHECMISIKPEDIAQKVDLLLAEV